MWEPVIFVLSSIIPFIQDNGLKNFGHLTLEIVSEKGCRTLCGLQKMR